jgi:hypothetical protein
MGITIDQEIKDLQDTGLVPHYCNLVLITIIIKHSRAILLVPSG